MIMAGQSYKNKDGNMINIYSITSKYIFYILHLKNGVEFDRTFLTNRATEELETSGKWFLIKSDVNNLSRLESIE